MASPAPPAAGSPAAAAAGARPPSFKPEAYTVGWITTLTIEFVAARAMLDERHERPHTPSDPYMYAAGSVNGHAVVIACSGEAGPAPANNCATQLMRSFPNVKFGLLSGIGGGVWTERHDVRLGDVVVSRPGQGHGGVAFYDVGKLTDEGLEPTGHLDRPPLALRSAVTYMEADQMLGDTEFAQYLGEVKARGLASTEGLTDELYAADDTTRKVERRARKGPEGPRIHYGLIASGSWVIKTSGSKREDLLRLVRGDVMCFEMEAAGLMNTFPCLVVRGICDYCDSHKNDDWHQYAAMTAACYCKWLLSYIRPAALTDEESAATRTDQPGARGAAATEPSKVRAAGMRDEDTRAVNEAFRAIRSSLLDEQCTLQALMTALQEMDQVVQRALSHHRQTAARAANSNITQLAQRILQSAKQADEYRRLLGSHWPRSDFSATYVDLQGAVEDRMEQVRHLRKSLSPGDDKQVIDGIFAGLTGDDFLVDIMAMPYT